MRYWHPYERAQLRIRREQGQSYDKIARDFPGRTSKSVKRVLQRWA